MEKKFAGIMWISRKELESLLFADTAMGAVFSHNGRHYILNSLEREDGSGKSFNATANEFKGAAVYTLHLKVK